MPALRELAVVVLYPCPAPGIPGATMPAMPVPAGCLIWWWWLLVATGGACAAIAVGCPACMPFANDPGGPPWEVGGGAALGI